MHTSIVRQLFAGCTRFSEPAIIWWRSGCMHECFVVLQVQHGPARRIPHREVEDTSVQMQDWFEANLDEDHAGEVISFLILGMCRLAFSRLLQEEAEEERRVTREGIEHLRTKTAALANFCTPARTQETCAWKGFAVPQAWIPSPRFFIPRPNAR